MRISEVSLVPLNIATAACGYLNHFRRKLKIDKFPIFSFGRGIKSCSPCAIIIKEIHLGFLTASICCAANPLSGCQIRTMIFLILNKKCLKKIFYMKAIHRSLKFNFFLVNKKIYLIYCQHEVSIISFNNLLEAFVKFEEFQKGSYASVNADARKVYCRGKQCWTVKPAPEF